MFCDVKKSQLNAIIEILQQLFSKWEYCNMFLNAESTSCFNWNFLSLIQVTLWNNGELLFTYGIINVEQILLVSQ